jgi:hypothetical protein
VEEVLTDSEWDNASADTPSSSFDKFNESSVLLGTSYTPGPSGNFWDESDANYVSIKRDPNEKSESEWS